MNITGGAQKVPMRDWLAIAGSCLGAFMAVVDSTMTNASLRDIQGTLSASADEASWVMTSYLIAEVITIAMTGWLSRVLSNRNYILISSVIFIIFSMICGLSRNLPMMIFARFFQGLSGGVLIPMAGVTIMSKLSGKNRITGLAFLSIILSFGPAIGPTLGGMITTTYGWPYSFYINLFPCFIVLLLIYFNYEKTPMQLHLFWRGDWPGIISMTTCLSTLVYILEEGNIKDWLSDNSILSCFIICVCSFALLIFFELRAKNPIIEFRLFCDRQFLFATLAVFLTSAFTIGNAYILPRYLLQIQGYSAFDVGAVMIWGGPISIPVALMMPYLRTHLDTRGLIIIGCLCLSASGFINTNLTHLSSGDQFILPQIFRAIGVALATTPLGGMALLNLESTLIASGNSLFNLVRILGGSFAIAGVGTLLSHRYFFHFSRISEKVTELNFNAKSALERGANLYSTINDNGENQAILTLKSVIDREAYIMSYADLFRILSIAVSSAIILVLLMKNSSAPSIEKTNPEH